MCCSDVKTYVQSGNVIFKSSESNGVAMGAVIEKALTVLASMLASLC